MFNELASRLSLLLSPLLHASPSPPCPHWLFLASPFLLRPMFFPLALTMLRERTEKKREKKGPSRYVFFSFLITRVFQIHCPPSSVPRVRDLRGEGRSWSNMEGVTMERTKERSLHKLEVCRPGPTLKERKKKKKDKRLQKSKSCISI